MEERREPHQEEHIWQNIRRLDSDVAELKVTTGSILTAQTSQGRALDRIENILSNDSKVNWPMITVGLVVIGMASSLIFFSIKAGDALTMSEVKENVKDIAEENVQTETLRDDMRKMAEWKGGVNVKLEQIERDIQGSKHGR